MSPEYYQTLTNTFNMNIRYKSLVRRSAIFAVAILLVVACKSVNRSKTDGLPAQPTAAVEQVEAESVATSGVLFKDSNGKVVSLNSLKGKVVFINFWATWCPPCIHEMPSINDMKKSFEGNDNIEFLMVDVDSRIEQSTAFMNKNDYDLPVYIPVGEIPSEYLGGAIPTTVVLNKKGEMVGRMEGGRDYTDPQIIKALIDLTKE